MKCANCGKSEHSHMSGKCQIDLHVDINADTIERFKATGHPKLLGIILKIKENKQNIFKDVEITRISS